MKVGIRSSERSNIGSSTRSSMITNATSNTAATMNEPTTRLSPHERCPASVSP
ncbi:Uncharacterised protein [Mycobacteroides abscessus subsp. abscessus]|nr:Uncharacterised protein [Mycobacteroides abscessus subsp. abscessus]